MTNYTAAAAVTKVNSLGFTNVHLDETRTVTIHQNWLPTGEEYAEFRLARGKFKGSQVGSAYHR